MIYLTSQQVANSIFKLAEGKVVERKPDGWKKALWSWHDVNHHWNYEDGETIIVEALSNCPEAELFLDGKSLGRQELANHPDHIYKWAVPFAAGNLEVIGYSGKETARYALQTSGVPTSLHLSSEDIHEGRIEHLTVELRDENGLPVRHLNKELSFSVDGAELLGVDNGAATNTYAFQGGKVKTSNGKALAVLRLGEYGSSVTVRTQGLPDATISLPYHNKTYSNKQADSK